MKSRHRQHGSAIVLAAAAVALSASVVHAGWIPTPAGTYDYLAGGNWDSSNINDDFPSSLTLGGTQIATFGANRTTPGDMNFNHAGNFGLTLRGTGANRILTLGGNVNVATTGGTSANVAIGSTSTNENLSVDLGGTTRTFTVATGRTLSLMNAVTNGTFVNAGSGSLTFRSTANTFTGNLVMDGATSVLTIGEPGAISDATLGNVNNDVSLLNGAKLKFGANNDKAHVLINPLRTFTLSGGAEFTTPYGSADVHIAGPIVGSGGLSHRTNLLLSGNNTLSGPFTYSSGLRFSSDANIGGSNSTLARGSIAGTVGLSILGTTLNNLSGHTLTFGSSDGISIDIQDPANPFTWDKIYTRQLNSGTNPTFVKLGLGTMRVTAAQTHNNATGIANVLGGGVVQIDYTAGGSLPNNAANQRLAFGGGTLHLLGKTGAPVLQTLSDVRLDVGGGSLVVDNQSGSSTTTLNIGNFNAIATAPAFGSSLDIRTINPGSGAATVTTTALNDATGLIGGGRVTFNGTSFATNSTNLSGGAIGAYAGATPGLGDGTLGSTANYIQTGTPTSPGAATYANTLKILTSGTGEGIDLGGQQLALTAGGLLFAGTENYAITNGTLKSANHATTSDLIIHQGSADTLTIGAVIANGGSGASTLTIAGTGKIVLTSPNTYTGITNVSGAVLSISNNNQLSNGTTAALNLYGGTLQATETISSGRAVGLLAGGGTIDIANTKTLTLSGAVTGGRLTLANSDGGNGTLVLSNANSIASGVAINAGVLRLNNNNAIHAQGFSTLSFGPAAGTKTLQINGARTITVAGLTSAATDSIIENGAAGAGVLNVYNGADNTYAGVLRDGSAGTLGLTKGGGAILKLTGTNTYTGTTTVNGGTLLVDGSTAAGSAVTVNAGTLGGIGAVNGPVTLNAGGHISPGSSPGTLITGSETWNGGGVYDWEINSVAGTAGTNWDLLSIAGSITTNAIAGNEFVIEVKSLQPGNAAGDVSNFNAAASYQFLIADATSAVAFDALNFDVSTASFSNAFNGTWTIRRGDDTEITGGDDTQLYLKYAAVPEPGMLSILGAGAMMLFRRRRAS